MKKIFTTSLFLGALMMLGTTTASAETVTYAVAEGVAHAAGSTDNVTVGDETVATITFGFEGGAEFKAPKADSTLEGFYGYTEGNGENGKPDSGTVYIINPKYDGTVNAGVVLNAGKKFYVLEDGVALPQYDGMTIEEKAYTLYEFEVTGGKEYKVYCAGSKLGFYGFHYTYGAAGGDESGVTDAVVKMTYIDGDDAYVNDSYGAIPFGEISKSGFNKISNGTVELGNKGWACNWITYLQVDASSVTANILKATLSFEGSGSTDNKRTTGWGVGYNSSEWNEDMTWLNADRSITLMGDVKWGTSKSSETYETYEFDITEALKNAKGNIATVLVYETAAAGGYIKNPVVTVEWSNAAVYNVTFKEATGVAATITLAGNNVTEGVALIDGTYEYSASAAGYYDYTGEFTVAGADLEVEFTMTAKPVYAYTVNGVDAEGNVLATVASGEGFAEEGVTYHYPAFILKDGTLYGTAQKVKPSPFYGTEGAVLDEDNKVFTETYDNTIADGIFYKEAEDMEGFTSLDSNNAPIRCSNGLGGNVAEGEDALLVTLAAGKYTITGQVWGTAGLTAGVKIKGAEEKVLWSLDSTGSLTVSSSEEFELTEETQLYVFTTGGNDKRMLDLIYITGIGGVVTGVENVMTEKAETVIYDLMGRRVQNPTSGIYVINGKKVCITRK